MSSCYRCGRNSSCSCKKCYQNICGECADKCTRCAKDICRKCTRYGGYGGELPYCQGSCDDTRSLLERKVDKLEEDLADMWAAFADLRDLVRKINQRLNAQIPSSGGYKTSLH